GVLTGLSAPELEAILAHELVHIRRHDALVNAAQVVLETVFFYHPAVWWLSRTIREERENCCDDAAAQLWEIGSVTGGPCSPWRNCGIPRRSR
ncbi:M56 family metallopeptidase, partial [Salmonella enterica]|uniref:M56 family metallopeptidase n=1 Tax=Salmonella enterica TaxID=28901 RepID=UPI003075DA78